MSSKRFPALDLLRGGTILLMILVNAPGDYGQSWSQLRHAEWNGFTLTDLVFPTFLFVVGNALAFTEDRLKSLSESVFYAQILKRGLILFLLGVLVNVFPFGGWNNEGVFHFLELSKWRIWGVLQRICLLYVLASICVRYTKPTIWVLLAISSPLLYELLLHLSSPENPYGLLSNLTGRIDRFMIPHSHLYNEYGVGFDPEGLLSTLPGLAQVLGGFMLGRAIKNQDISWTYWTFGAIALCLVSYTVHRLGWFPINKKLWTGSFVSITFGLDVICLAALCWALKVWPKLSHTFSWVLSTGKNPLFLYLLSEAIIILCNKFKVAEKLSLRKMLFLEIYQPTFGGMLGSAMQGLSIVAICILVGYILDRNKVYIKI